MSEQTDVKCHICGLAMDEISASITGVCPTHGVQPAAFDARAALVARTYRAEAALEEARRRLRVNSIAWHTQFHSGDWETCGDSSCTNDHEVLGSLGPEWRPQELSPALAVLLAECARREARDE